MLKTKFINLDEDVFVNIENITDELLINFGNDIPDDPAIPY